MNDLVYLCDFGRHLICVPYSIPNLHRMAEDLGIKRCWFHRDHYDVPLNRINEIRSKCFLGDTKSLVRILKHAGAR